MTARMWFLLCEYHHMLCKIIFNCNYYIDVVSPLCIFPYTFQECLYTQKPSHSECMNMVSPLCVSSYDKMTSLYKSYLSMAACVWFFLCMYLEILCKIRFFVESLLTMTALMCFSPVCIFMCITRVPSHAKTFSQ